MANAIIIGGGVAGPAAAAALQRVGITGTVYETHTGPAEGLGAFLSLAPNGLAALGTIGMLDPVRRVASFPTTSIEFVNRSGKRLGLLADGSQDGPPELRTMTVKRGALQRALAEAAQAQGLEIHYAKQFVGYTSDEDSVTAEFADGTTATGDVLVGCDGIHSPVRRAMDPQAPGPHYTGLLGIGGYVTEVDVAATAPDTMRMVFGTRAFFGYQTGPSGEVYWFANLGSNPLSREQIRARTDHWWKQFALKLFRDDLADITTILERAAPASFRPLSSYDLPSLPQWSDRRAVLLGDAAHAVTHSSGQGASLAIEDALVLATSLRDHPNITEALTAYEHQRRQRVEAIAAEGRKRGNQKTGSSHPVALFIRDTTMRVVFALIARFGSQAWINEYRIDFDTPTSHSTSPGGLT